MQEFPYVRTYIFSNPNFSLIELMEITTRRGAVFLTTTIYTCISVNLAVAVGPSTLQHILQEAGYRGDAYVPDLNNSVSCLNTYV